MCVCVWYNRTVDDDFGLVRWRTCGAVVRGVESQLLERFVVPRCYQLNDNLANNETFGWEFARRYDMFLLLLLLINHYYLMNCTLLVPGAKVNLFTASEVTTLWRYKNACFFRSTLRQSRPNIAGLKCSSRTYARTYIRTYVRTSIRPQNVPSISVKFGMQLEVDEWCTTVCSMTRCKVKVKVTRPLKLEIRSIFKSYSVSPPPFTMRTGNWQRILKLGHNS